jgi:hypothetical protein
MSKSIVMAAANAANLELAPDFTGLESIRLPRGAKQAIGQKSRRHFVDYGLGCSI